jgi:gluconokinase
VIPTPPFPPLVVVMGVTGSGKTTVGEALARRLGLEFADADDFHPESNVAKMAAGTPLDDEDRHPWLQIIGAWLALHTATGGVISCSALKRSYRDLLRAGSSRVTFVHLHGPREVVAARVAGRPGHFMPASLVDSQLATLEPLEADEPGLQLDLDAPVGQIIDRYLHAHPHPTVPRTAARADVPGAF